MTKRPTKPRPDAMAQAKAAMTMAAEARIGQLLGEAGRDHDRRAGATSVVTDIAKDDGRSEASTP